MRTHQAAKIAVTISAVLGIALTPVSSGAVPPPPVPDRFVERAAEPEAWPTDDPADTSPDPVTEPAEPSEPAEPTDPAEPSDPLPGPMTPLTGPIVTLGFDDGTSDHAIAAQLLRKYGLRGVFYVNSGRLDTPGYLTTRQVRQMQRHRQEIGGHTAFHLRLSQQDRAEQERQICFDRNQLLADGLRVTDFAYPFNDFTADTAALVRRCGYASARTTDGIGCSSCDDYETVPARDPYGSRALSGFGLRTTAADLIAAVDKVPSGGWLQMVFHRICTRSCDANSVRLTEFTKFVRWLSDRRSDGEVGNATPRQLLGGTVTTKVAQPPPTATRLAFQNPSFEEPGRGDGDPPRCFSYGSAAESDMATWRTVADGHTGRLAMRADIRRLSGSVRVYTTQDLGSCAPPVRTGGYYRIGVWYKSTGPVKTAAYLRQSNGGYLFFGATSVFPAAPGWRLATWVVGPIPAGSGRALSAAVVMTATGRYTFDDFAITTVAAPAHRAASPGGTETRNDDKHPASVSTQPTGEAFVPPNGGPPLAGGGSGRVTARLAAQSGWLGWSEIAASMVAVLFVLILLDRRFRYLHRRSRRGLPPDIARQQ